jgi:general secretion pathway protein L
VAVLRILLTEVVPQQDTPLAWAVFETHGVLRAQGCSCLADMPQVESCAAIAPAAVVSFITVKLPARSGEKARRLLPFAVEEQLAVETDTVHFALGDALPDGTYPVAVVDKVWLQRSLAILAEHGLMVQQLYPETLLPPLSADTWSVVWQGQSGWVRTGEQSGLALEGEAFAALTVSRALKQHPPQQLQLYAADIPEWATQCAIPVVQQAPWQWTDTAWHTVRLDLLQGEFARRQFNWRGFAPFLPVLWLGGAMLLLQLVGTGVDVWRMKREQQQLHVAMETSFRAAFPEATVVVDPVLQMERQRASLRRAAGIVEKNDFLSLLNQLVPLLAGVPAQKILYENQSLKIELHLPDTAALEALRHRIHAAPFKTEFVATGMDVRIQVSE